MNIRTLSAGMVLLASGTFLLAGDTFAAGQYGIYCHHLSPRENPAWNRVRAKPVDRAVFNGRYDYVSAKGASVWNSNEFDRLTRELDCGRIVHPVIGSLFSPGRETAFSNLVHKMKDRGLVMFGPWWQVPAWGKQVHPSREQYEYLESQLGDLWFGMENGEQDARYVRSFCAGKWPQGGKDRFSCYVDFNRFFDRFSEWMGDKMSLFCVSTLVPYLLREGTYTCLGMETSQMHPNTQVSYAFIRGAGKQYGVPWYGDVSVYGRWGWKNNKRRRTEPKDFDSGREDMGTSYSLMKRLAYEQYLHNCIFGSMEAIQFDGSGNLFGSGEILRDVRNVHDKYGDPGVMYTPVAVMIDTLAGWNVPRLAREDSWRFCVWGSLAYEESDYLTLGVFDVLYPGFEAGHYFADERGYIVGTPYGDIADAILSDAPAWLLKRYPVLVLAGMISPSEELRDSLREYLECGGHIVLTEGNRKVLPASCPGKVTVIPGALWGVERNANFKETRYDRNRPRWNYEYDRLADVRYVLTAEARNILKRVFAGVRLFSASKEKSDGLSVIACRRSDGEWSVGVFNNLWRSQPFALSYNGGSIRTVEEVPTIKLDRRRIGHYPEGLEPKDAGEDTPETIAGGSVRLFRVKTSDVHIRELPVSKPPAEPKNRTLSLYGRESLREQLLRRPTFFRHFDGVKVDARYMLEKSAFAAEEEARWLKVRKVGVMVDFTDIVDRFAGLRITREDPVENERSDKMLDEILQKMKIYGVEDCIVALHHVMHNSMSQSIPASNLGDYERAVARFAGKISNAGCKVHLRMARFHVAVDFRSLEHWASVAGASKTFSLASALALTKTPVSQGQEPLSESMVLREAEKRSGDIWLLAAPGFDGNNDRELSLTEPLAVNAEWVLPYIDIAKRKNARVVFDAYYENCDEEYRDAKLFESR